MSKLYKSLPIRCSLSLSSLEECAVLMEPRRNYKLFVNPHQFPYASLLLKHIGALTQDHPFAPYINLLILPELKIHEWFLEGDAGEAWGSEEVG